MIILYLPHRLGFINSVIEDKAQRLAKHLEKLKYLKNVIVCWQRLVEDSY